MFIHIFTFLIFFTYMLNAEVLLPTFPLASSLNLQGNIKVIGNTVLQFNGTIGASSNANLALTYVDIDNDPNTFNSSSASVQALQNNVDISNAKIIWAGLYWQGYLNNYNNANTTPLLRNFSGIGATDRIRMQNIINNQPIQFQVNNQTYAISPVDVAMDLYRNTTTTSSYKYAAFANITNILQNTSPVNTFTISNLYTCAGRTYNNNDGLGNYGAWALVLVYNNSQNPIDKIRNISIFNGYSVVSQNNNQTILINGFKTPKVAPNGVDSTISIFAGEGDANILGDFAQIRNQNNLLFNLPSAPNTASYFASAIEGVPTRNPSITNNQGIDIHTTQIGTISGNNFPISTNQTNASLILGTGRDVYMPSMVAFATELYIPKLCYDYSITTNNTTLLSKNRKIKTIGDENLSINIAIKSQEGDFDFEQSKLKISLSSTAYTSISSLQYSPNTVNILIDAIETENSSSTHPEIGIGKDVGAYPTSGGTIGTLERYFAKFNYTLEKKKFDGTFNIDINTSINFGSGPVTIISSTSNGSLPRCEQNLIYNPQWGQFNVERVNSGNYNPVTQANQRFPLYTQVSGRDFDASVVVYDAKATPPYSQQLTLTEDYYVDLELIDVSKYNDQDSFFACQDTDPAIIQSLGDNNESLFIKIPAEKSRVDIEHENDILTHKALQEAAFRIWSIVDLNNTLITHTCDAPSKGACFRDIYINKIRQETPDGHYCDAPCSTGNDSNRNCYDCLRTYYAHATCSRDNFAIRPVSYSLHVLDTNESNNTSDSRRLLASNTETSNVPSLAAGYKYKFEANATQYLSKSYAQGYYGLFDNTQARISSFKFQDSTGNACADNSDYPFNLRFNNGQIDATIDDNGEVALGTGEFYAHSNVGDYHYHIEDNNWTIVDQKRYAYKTFPDVDDCNPNDHTISENGNNLSGCVISSDYSEKGYYDLALRYEPYRFDVSGINYTLPHSYNNFVYLNNDINDSEAYKRNMSARFSGKINALGKDNSVMSNFTDTCAAHAVTFNIENNISKNGQEVNASEIYSDDGESKRLFLRQNHISSTNIFGDIQENKDSNDPLAITISSNEFKAEDNASATIKLFYNFKRYPYTPVNPITIHFIQIEANSTASQSNAHMRPDYIPSVEKAIDYNATFLSMRIASTQTLYNIPAAEDDILIPYYTEVYCDAMGECDELGLDRNDSRLGNPNGYKQFDVNSSSGDGSLDIFQDNPDNGITFTTEDGTTIDNDTSTNFNLANPTPIRSTNTSGNKPYDANITVGSSSGFYDNAKHQEHFNGGGGWAGTGKTGLIVDTNASDSEAAKRVDW